MLKEKSLAHEQLALDFTVSSVLALPVPLDFEESSH